VHQLPRHHCSMTEALRDAAFFGAKWMILRKSAIGPFLRTYSKRAAFPK
jgi:hypothetical protein